MSADRSAGNNLTRRVTVMMTPQQHEFLAAEARRRHISVADWIRRLLFETKDMPLDQRLDRLERIVENLAQVVSPQHDR